MHTAYISSGTGTEPLNNKPIPVPAVNTSSSTRLEGFIFFSLVIILLIPVWSVEYFPSQDAPIHRWLLQIMADYGKSDGTILRDFLIRNWAIEPNMGFYLIAYPISWFVDLHTAEKLFLSIYAFLFAYGVRYTIGSLNQNTTIFSFLVLPTIFSYYIHVGFYNFQLGVALFFPAIAYSIAVLKINDRKSLWKIGLIATGLAVVHLVPFAIYAFTLAVFFVSVHFIYAIKQHQILKAFIAAIRTGSLLTLWMLPSILIFMSFTQRHGVSETPEVWPKYMLGELLKLRFTQSFSSFEMTFIVLPLVILIVITAGLLARQLFNLTKYNIHFTAIFVATISLVFMYLFFPFSSKDVPLNQRLAPMLFLLGLLAISFATPKRLHCVSIIFAISVIVCLQSMFRLDVYQMYSARIKSLDSVQSVIGESSTFLNVTLVNDNQVAVRGEPLHRTHSVRPMLHAGANAAIARRSMYMRSALMSPTEYGYFPYTYRKNMDPFQIFGMDLEEINPILDISIFQNVTGRPIDYIVVTGAHSESVRPAADAEFAVLEQIEQKYKHVISSADGWYHLYALRQDQFKDTPSDLTAVPALSRSGIVTLTTTGEPAGDEQE
jgi:hypothetical protein